MQKLSGIYNLDCQSNNHNFLQFISESTLKAGVFNALLSFLLARKNCTGTTTAAPAKKFIVLGMFEQQIFNKILHINIYLKLLLSVFLYQNFWMKYGFVNIEAKCLLKYPIEEDMIFIYYNFEFPSWQQRSFVLNYVSLKLFGL